MSLPNSQGDPRTGRDRRTPARARTFQDGKVDPVINNKRPLLTIGNGLLLVVGIGYGMYATGHLPQLDAFFNHVDEVGKANNSTVVNALITYGTVIFGCILLGLFGLVVFSLVNAHRRRESDPRGWEKLAKQPPERRKNERRQQEDLPSLIMPIGKERPERLSKTKPIAGDAVPVVAEVKPVAPPAATVVKAAADKESMQPAVKQAAVTPVKSAAPIEAKTPSAAKLAAMQAARKAEEAADAAPPDLPSFVLPYGKTAKAATKVMKKVEEPKPVVEPTVATAAQAPVVAVQPAAPVAAQIDVDTARVEAAVAAARAAALKAEAAVAAAKAEAAIAIAKAEAAAAEAAIAAAKVEVQAA